MFFCGGDCSVFEVFIVIGVVRVLGAIDDV